MIYYDVIMSGFGGQGILLIGNLLSYAAISEGKEVSFFPAYGVEMRGGTANCTVVISDKEIGSPVVGSPLSAIIMNAPSYEKFYQKVKEGGAAVINTSLITIFEKRKDINTVLIPANEIAAKIVDVKLASMVALGAYVKKTRVVSIDSLIQNLKNVISSRNLKYLPLNEKALLAGYEYVK